MPKELDNVTIEDARLIFKNFKGQEGPMNREGDRNFCVLLDDDVAAAMRDDGWNIKTLKPREGDEDPEEQPYVNVSVRFGGRPPRIMLLSSNSRTQLDEESVDVLDWIDIRLVDLVIRPYEWTVNGASGVKAYLKTMFVTIEEDDLDLKYANLDDLPARAGAVDE